MKFGGDPLHTPHNSSALTLNKFLLAVKIGGKILQKQT